jgi:hypothetical protein
MYRYHLKLAVESMVFIIFLTFGCQQQRESVLIFEVYSECKDSIRILECKGLGAAQPSGIVTPSTDGVPSSRLVSRGTPFISNDFIIRWRNLRTNEEFQQKMNFPSGSFTDETIVECRLDKDNTWLWKLRSER